jgi:hypothetical protein
MTDKRLHHRVIKLEFGRTKADARGMVIRPGDVAEQRELPPGATAFVMAPRRCRTTDEWLATYAPLAVRHE